MATAAARGPCILPCLCQCLHIYTVHVPTCYQWQAQAEPQAQPQALIFITAPTTVLRAMSRGLIRPRGARRQAGGHGVGVERFEQAVLSEAGGQGGVQDALHGHHVGVEQGGLQVMDDVAAQRRHGRRHGDGEGDIGQVGHLHHAGWWVMSKVSGDELRWMGVGRVGGGEVGGRVSNNKVGGGEQG